MGFCIRANAKAWFCRYVEMRAPIAESRSPIADQCIVDSNSSTEDCDRCGFDRREERRKIISIRFAGREFCWDLGAVLVEELAGGERSRELSAVQRRCLLAARTRATLRV